jgi:hypothetical protein
MQRIRPVPDDAKEINAKRILDKAVTSSIVVLTTIILIVSTVAKYDDSRITELILLLLLGIGIVDVAVLALIYLKSEKVMPVRFKAMLGDMAEMYEKIKNSRGRIIAVGWLIIQTVTSTPAILKMLW